MKFELKNYLSNPFKVIKIYKEFGKNPYKSKNEIESEIFKKLKNLCIYCNTHVPYYRRVFKEIGFVPENMKNYNDFKKIPILDKDIVRKYFLELQSDEIEHMNKVLCSTSGSTGTPLKIYLDASVNRAIFCKLWHLWNQDKKWHIGKVLLTLDGDNIELVKKNGTSILRTDFFI